MSARVTLTCDGCPAATVYTPGSPRHIARALGWSIGRGKHNRVLDFCPTCTRERRAKLAAEGPAYV